MVDLKEFSGHITRNEISFTFAVSKVTTKKNYSHMLRVNLLDPSNNKVFQDLGLKNAALKKVNQQIERVTLKGDAENEKLSSLLSQKKKIEDGKTKFNAQSSRYLKEDELRIGYVQKIAYDCATELLAKHELSLLRILKENPRIGNLNSNQMRIRYLEDFLKSLPKCAENTLKKKRRILKRACDALMLKTIPELTEKDIDKLFRDSELWKHRKMVMDFFEFGRNNNAYIGNNPVFEYINSFNRIRKTRKSPYNPELNHIPKLNEIKLHDVIKKHIKDPEIMAVILVKCAGVSLTESLKIRWRELVDDGESIILVRTDPASGIMRNLSRPILREGTELIRLIISQKKEKMGDKIAWEGDLVVPIRNSKKERESKTTRLTNYIRRLFRESGLSNNQISAYSSGDKKAGGACVTLLKLDYEYKLTNSCGIERKSEEFDYLRGVLTNTVLNRYYRSMNDTVSGLPFFETIVRRDDDHIPMETMVPKAIVEKTDNERVITIPSAGARRRTLVTIDIPVKAGTLLSIESNYGVRGECSMISESNELPTIIKTVY